ncbi:putative bifunctional diguanylate cyclase/phosphodiesterase [Zobellella endophytica]|uniref:putative bifunctional diguanylate cyclase/phosphodiesterase n=1 Tax=Zobellella endophytica TaxID=2116700 RepID=UPI001FECC048|nr:EAL domain-containing protein [Zobellella endophytica]
MTKLKLLLLTGIALLFGFSSLYSYHRDLEVVRYVSATIKAIGWASSELETETLKFDHALSELVAGTSDEANLQLRFELLWSRVDILLQGEENQPLREQPGMLPLLQRFRTQLERWEQPVYGLTAADRAGILALQQEVAAYRTLTREINVESFSGANVWQQLNIIQDIRLRSMLYLAGLFSSGGLMLWMLVRENRRNRHLAYHDMLTGLPNRMFFYQLMGDAMAAAQKERHRIAVHMVDLNEFKAINDSLGHEVGDRLLRMVAARLRQTIGDHGQVARLGGDEFVVIQRLAEVVEAEQMAQRLWRSLSREIRLNDGCLSPMACIGTSLYPDHGTTMPELLSHADTAMYYAKNQSQGAVQLFEPGMNEQRLRSQKMAVALQAAIEKDELVLHYQPIFHLGTGRIESLEALLRWQSPEFGRVCPLELIAVAEHHGLARALNEWVLYRACRQLRQWQLAGFGWLKINVNISPSIFMRGELAEAVGKALLVTGVGADALVLEITEDTSLWDTAGSIDTLHELRRLGVEIALDDFGTGYSSFSHLRQLPVNKLKIDKSFVADLSTDGRAVSLVKTIIDLARSLEMSVTAEGIEQAEQQQRLQQLGCELGQGYLLARPMPAEEVADWLVNDCPPYSESV